MKNLFKKFLFLGLTSVLLSSCSIWSIVGSSSQDSLTAPKESLSSDDKGSTNVLPVSAKNIGDTVSTSYCPTKGNVNVLVIPIEFSDYPFSRYNNFSNVLQNTLNGDGAKDTGYWESVSSYYRKSSYGLLNLIYTVAPVYKTNITAQQAIAYHGNGDNGGYFLKNSVANYKASNNVTKFDSDRDGYIDCVIMVYSCPNYSSTQANYSDNSNSPLMWAFTYWAPYTSSGSSDRSWVLRDFTNPNPNTYIWLSYDFIYKGSNKGDCHTLVHETGHSLGLDDYYPDSTNKYYPMGGQCMMDLNILDHDAYSKLIFGWYDPVVVQESAVINIKPNATDGSAVLIPTGNWNGTAWDEYLLLEYYRPINLNYADSFTQYPNRPLGINDSGIKIYHVDSRLIKYVDNINFYYLEGELRSLDTRFMYQVAASNYQKKNGVDGNFNLVELIDCWGRKFSATSGFANNLSLFKEGSTFKMSSHSNVFPNGNKMNNGEAFPYTITVNSVTNEYAQVKIIKG